MAMFFGTWGSSNAQKPSTGNAAFDAELNGLLCYSIPLVTAEELKAQLGAVKLFDTRELNEYLVSHLPGAVYAGFNQFDKSIFEKIEKDDHIVLYCSVGYRSEKIGEKLQKMGFTNVSNLYGSIFEWVNKGYPVENFTHNNTKEVHTYNEKWSQWVTNPAVKKVW